MAENIAACPEGPSRYRRWHKSRFMKFLLHRVTFLRAHFAYFILSGLLGAVVMFAIEASNVRGSMDFFDALFMSYSAICSVGLSTVDLRTMRAGSQVTMTILVQMGGFVFVSVVPLIVRRYWYRKLYDEHDLQTYQVEVGGHVRVEVEESMNRFDRHVLEYRGMGKLLVILCLYQAIAYVVAFTILAPYLSLSSARNILDANEVNSPVWFTLALVISAFCNAGFALMTTNLVPLQTDYVVLITLSVLILLGFTFFPIALRWIVRLLFRFSKSSQDKLVYQFLLTHPRRCFAYLFPTVETQFLLLVLVVMTGMEYALSLGLDFHLPVLASIPPLVRFMTVFFQTVSTRTAGFNVIDLALINPAVQFVELVYMYLAAIPVRYSLRTSAKMQLETIRNLEAESQKARHYAHLKLFRFLRELHFMLTDTMLLFLCTVIISVIESERLKSDPDFGIFKLIYEIVSAYGTVGLTLGYPGVATSFSTVLNPGSHIMMCVVMLIGRHRGLPPSLDRAVQAPRPRKPRLNRMHTAPEILVQPVSPVTPTRISFGEVAQNPIGRPRSAPLFAL